MRLREAGGRREHGSHDPRVCGDAGINVMGHIGMTPQTATSFGGFRVQGGTPEAAGSASRTPRLWRPRACSPWLWSAFPAWWPRPCRRKCMCPSWALAPVLMWTARCW
ncbi:MAG: 3-methyl-2-oxobutanoate hydroxymethyltransferase [Oscillospiraceae bacterium]